ncbi:MAG TPA: hypothetical protein VFN88_05260 [Caulobacteraceae bacterium]|nr:hypothetical protein [Caulobacteraceae bacterium]
MTKLRFPALAVAGALMLSAVTPAFAGEITGQGKLTPGGDNAASACAFSGLNDHPVNPPEGDFPGKIQNFAFFIFFFEDLLGIDLTPQSDELPFTAADDCRGNVEFGG